MGQETTELINHIKQVQQMYIQHNYYTKLLNNKISLIPRCRLTYTSCNSYNNELTHTLPHEIL